MDNFTTIVNRNHDEKAKTLRQAKAQKHIIRIDVCLVIIIAAFITMLFDLMHVWLATTIMVIAWSVACYSFGRCMRFVLPKS